MRADAVLVVDDDSGLADALSWGLKHRGVAVRSARTVAEACRTTREQFALVVLDLRLPDGTGFDVLEHYSGIPFVLVSGFLETPTTIQAMRQGAVDVLEKPVDLAALIRIIVSLLDDRFPPSTLSRRANSVRLPPSLHPVAAAWAESVVRACTSPRDLVTVTAWGRHVGVGRSTIAEQSRILGLSARAGRDLARGLRAIVRSSWQECAPVSLLDVRDRRTLAALLTRLGLDDGGVTQVSVDRFLARQQLVPKDSAAFLALQRAVRSVTL